MKIYPRDLDTSLTSLAFPIIKELFNNKAFMEMHPVTAKKITNLIKEHNLLWEIKVKLLDLGLLHRMDEFEWEDYSDTIVKYLPQYISHSEFDWLQYSHLVLKLHPTELDINKACIDDIIHHYPKFENMSLKQIKKQAIINKL